MKHNFKRMLLLTVCMVLLTAMALTLTACNQNKPAQTLPEEGIATHIGQGEKQFSFHVIDPDGKETLFTVKTDKETVGEALMELGLIEGEEGPYGLFVKTVNGITVDYDVDGKYWAFYENGEYAVTGVDTTPVTPGSSYSFKVE